MRTTQSPFTPTSEAQALEQWSRARYLEALRTAVRRELRVHKGTRALADEMGIHRNSLRKFVEGQSEPWPATLARIEEWAGNRPSVEPPNGVVALSILVSGLTPSDRPDARRTLARRMREFYHVRGEAPPTWLAFECMGADD